ncbi:hypothetical protein [Arthrobacter woluwensis]|uniref:hypothetical protein n=1 Tax=Arthrobacter woluwensis TaxID=156980 RepID=UPI001AB007CB|nr:hypothetical protein [Arthrobacter woluwensis]QTF71771.1 hypothetical protein G8758_06960 [Arthrobacter woluwensis]
MITIREKVPGPNGDKPAAGRLEFTPTRTRVKGTTEVLPAPFIVELDDAGEAVAALDPTGPDWCWKVSRSIDGVPGDSLFVAVAPGDTEWSGLVRVDPATMEPAASPEPAWWALARSTVTHARVDATGDLIMTRADGTEVNAGSVLDPAKVPVSVEVTNGQGGTVRLTRLDSLVVGAVIEAPSNLGAGASYRFGAVPEGFRPITFGQLNGLTLGPCFNAITSNMSGAWQYLNIPGAVEHVLALWTNEANGLWLGSIVWGTADDLPVVEIL